MIGVYRKKDKSSVNGSRLVSWGWGSAVIHYLKQIIYFGQQLPNFGSITRSWWLLKAWWMLGQNLYSLSFTRSMNRGGIKKTQQLMPLLLRSSGGKIIALYNVKLFLTHISVLVAQIKKLKKADWHFFGHFSRVEMHAPTHLACNGSLTLEFFFNWSCLFYVGRDQITWKLKSWNVSRRARTQQPCVHRL